MRWQRVLRRIDEKERIFREQSDAQLQTATRSLRFRAKSGEKLTKLLPEAFALVREAARRTVQMRHFDVQLLGGIALARNSIAEMETGEGKTLTATLPLYLYALAGKGAHLSTVNDYLARRDTEWMGPIYECLGISVGVVEAESSPADRQRAYACDITYGTAKEFGFDFLRDRLQLRGAGEDVTDLGSRGTRTIQRPPFFALIDEADSIMIDEARTPLVIGTMGGEQREQIVACFRWGAQHADRFVEDEHFQYDNDKKKVDLTPDGCRLARVLSQVEHVKRIGLGQLYEYVERAVKVRRDFHHDQHYVVRNAKVVIVDEFTGRIGEGRKWQHGIHEAIEAKEGLEPQLQLGQAARITVQDLLRRYPHLAGMTGTARNSATEFRKVYKRRVSRIPTNRPVRRQRESTRLFRLMSEKWEAIVDEVKEMHSKGRPVLIGTRTIEKSEQLSKYLSEADIPHHVLNARHIDKEAEIVARAGQLNRVTVATNMAGRGTDIILGGNAETLAWARLQDKYKTRRHVPLEEWNAAIKEIEDEEDMVEQGEVVKELGGLHVICTELHESSRIDRQLIGRCGRQGDLGTFRQYLSLDDDILPAAFGMRRAERMRARAESRKSLSRTRMFRRGQRRVERTHLRQRMILLHHEKERKKIHREMGQDPYLDTCD